MKFARLPPLLCFFLSSFLPLLSFVFSLLFLFDQRCARYRFPSFRFLVLRVVFVYVCLHHESHVLLFRPFDLFLVLGDVSFERLFQSIDNRGDGQPFEIARLRRQNLRQRFRDGHFERVVFVAVVVRLFCGGGGGKTHFTNNNKTTTLSCDALSLVSSLRVISVCVFSLSMCRIIGEGNFYGEKSRREIMRHFFLLLPCIWLRVRGKVRI